MSSPAHGERKHEIFSASSAFRWAGYPGEPGCPGSAMLAQKMPAEPSSAAAEEGTQAHEVLEAVLKGDGDWRLRLATAAVRDEQMRAGVKTALEYVHKLRALYPQLQVYSEIKLELMPGVGGSFDILLYCPVTFQMWVCDFKYGKQPVSARENPQLLCYAVFAARHFRFAVFAVHLVVIQPRDFTLAPGDDGVKTWTCGMDVVEAWEAQIVRAVEEAKQEPPMLRPRADRCRRCRAVAICEAVTPECAALPVAFVQPPKPRKSKKNPDPVKPDPFFIKGTDLNGERVQPEDLDPSVLRQVGAAFAGSWAVKAYLKGVEEIANELAITHKLPLPGCKVVVEDARLSWDADGVAIANELWRLARISPNHVLPQSLISITAAKDLLKTAIIKLKESDPELDDEIIWSDFAKLTKRVPSGSMKLVLDSDPRPSAETAAAIAFDNLLVMGAEEVQGR
jgi:hypothetical protein